MTRMNQVFKGKFTYNYNIAYSRSWAYKVTGDFDTRYFEDRLDASLFAHCNNGTMFNIFSNDYNCPIN